MLTCRGRKKRDVSKSRHASPVKCSAWFAGPILRDLLVPFHDPTLISDTHTLCIVTSTLQNRKNLSRICA